MVNRQVGLVHEFRKYIEAVSYSLGLLSLPIIFLTNSLTAVMMDGGTTINSEPCDLTIM